MNTGVRKFSAPIQIEREREGATRKGLLRAAGAAARGLQLRPALRLVLEKLAACYGEQAFALMVWPSNAWLIEATGLAERTVRLTIAELVRLKLLAPIDSANRKRFARRDRTGKVIEAFGFDLAPLYDRRHEFEGLVSERRERERLRAAAFDEITIHRKSCEAMIAETAGAETLAGELATLIRTIPRRSSAMTPDRALAGLRALRERLEAFFTKESGSAGADCRHIEADSNASIENGQTDEVCDAQMIAEACPALTDFGETVRTVADLKRVGVRMRPLIQASPDAWREVVALVGEARAAALVLYVLQCHVDDEASGRPMIKSPGGLFRSLGRRLAAGEMNLVAELQALRRKKATGAQKGRYDKPAHIGAPRAERRYL